MAARRTRNWLALAAALATASPALAGQRPLTRLFTPGAEEHYRVTVAFKAETRTVATEAVAEQTYVTPVVHVAEVSLGWRSVRRVLAVHGDGSAETEEAISPLATACEGARQPEGRSDAKLQESLAAVCSALLKAAVLRGVEGPNGLLRESARDLPCDL